MKFEISRSVFFREEKHICPIFNEKKHVIFCSENLFSLFNVAFEIMLRDFFSCNNK